METKQRVRSRNFIESEKKLLFDLVTTQYLHIVASKETDAVTIARKNLAWQEITQMFNRQSQTGHRTAKQLHALYDCMKKAARGKKETPTTGGGSFAQIVRPHEPLQNEYVSSALYAESQPSCSRDSDIIEDFKVEETSTDFDDVSTNEASSIAIFESASASATPVVIPISVDTTGRKRTAEKSVQVQDIHDEELQQKKLAILNTEHKTKLTQLALVDEQLQQQKKMFELNYQARLEEIEFERKVREIKLKKLEN